MPAQLSLVFDSSEKRKARGAFFTPLRLAEFLASWAVRSPKDRILEPSCGHASILSAAGRRLRALGGRTTLHGLDVHPPSISAARACLRGEGLRSALRIGDFFDEPAAPRFDVVIGNPPYIRYQSFSGKDRLKAQRAALSQGVRLSGLANAWAAFVVHAASFLRKHGRLALVLPAALLSVNYAASVRRFLLDRFRSVQLVMFEERVFPEVLEEVVLLLAEGEGPTPRFDLFQVHDLDGLQALGGPSASPARPWSPAGAEDKWTEALLPPEAARAYAALTAGPSFEVLSAWGDTDLGMVTGKNTYFTLTAAEVARLGLPEGERLRISPPGSSHLRGLAFTDRTFEEMAGAGARVYLFYPDRDDPSEAARRYIDAGEQRGVHAAYKCAVRSPWWRVPTARVPDLFLTYMNHDTPRLVWNQAGAAHLNSIHGVTLKRDRRELGADLLPLAMLNSATLLGAELVGRSYGGGILKIEPKEADRLPMPSPAALDAAGGALRALRPELADHLRSGRMVEVVRAVDEALLVRAAGVRPGEVAALSEARARMAARRVARAGKPR
ncbi:N-6 DNA methylase [Sorangium sp. So ce131]|uniref:N-6 DNA methylase n=1 Tax=Sorangium sp. So ce131 TaxID=3133282 RepID=UPI003F5DE93C